MSWRRKIRPKKQKQRGVSVVMMIYLFEPNNLMIYYRQANPSHTITRKPHVFEQHHIYQAAADDDDDERCGGEAAP